ncbi:hypothetical protein [Epiphyas postvittana nucleopolyhedrovirus]|uniref:LEF-12 n=1 Tax=Epiphyas postvittana nucleopolyhedrovirus TaxID=70600 RepID=Q91GL3_NPVEP|nr:hypothetical protein [Epiphyas postvittana nucleopolyhedrovirus]AAK85602.1 unknown [Epiphyas postvittana nucleopolyhedrovirus]
MESLAIANKDQFNKRLAYVNDIVIMMQRTMDFMAARGQCTRADAATLCLADDTAAWLCDRADHCTFVSFRVRITAFQHPCRALQHFMFEESLTQRFSKMLPRYTYMNYSLFKNLFAIKLTVYRGDVHVDGPPYFVHFNGKCVHARVRTNDAILYQIPLFEQGVEDIIAQSMVEQQI